MIYFGHYLHLLGRLYFGIVGLAPLARHFFATAKKSTQKRPSPRRAPRKKHGVPIEVCQITCCARTHPQKTCGLRHADTENSCYLTHLNGLAKVREGQKQKTRKQNSSNLKSRYILQAPFLTLLFHITSASHLIGGVIMGFLYQHV